MTNANGWKTCAPGYLDGSVYQNQYDGVTGDYGYGWKLSTYDNHAVIEASNDGTDTYYKTVGQTFTLPSP